MNIAKIAKLLNNCNNQAISLSPVISSSLMCAHGKFPPTCPQSGAAVGSASDVVVRFNVLSINDQDGIRSRNT